MNTELINNVWIILALVAAMSACVGMVFLTAWIKQLCKHQTQRDATLSSLQNTTNLLSREVLEARENRQQLQAQFKKLRAKRSQLDPNGSDAKPYSEAIKMVKKGATVNDLISLCGLSENEAELIFTIHGMSRANAEIVKNGVGLI